MARRRGHDGAPGAPVDPSPHSPATGGPEAGDGGVVKQEDLDLRIAVADLLDARVAIAGGTTTAVIGPNGAGKSTLLRAIAGLPVRGGAEVAGGVPRAVLLWGQHWELWGAGALGLGLWAFLRRAGVPLCAAAVALGVAAVVNYNATWGMVGAALGAWTWIGRPGSGSTRV